MNASAANPPSGTREDWNEMTETNRPPAGHPARLAVGIIGAGRVGTALGVALTRAGHQVVAASAVADASVQRARANFPDAVITEPGQVLRHADLILLTDDVYGTFADDFVSLFALAPKNTILVYSYSKYFGATGWRLGTIATHRDNVLDRLLAELPKDVKKELHTRYESITTEPDKLKFIDRLVADSRTVALNHTAGLSTPQQVQMVLFSLFSLMDTPDAYKNALKRLIRSRKEALYEEVGISFKDDDPNQVDYYTILDIEFLGERMFGRKFVEWLLKNTEPTELLFRLAREARVVLLPGKGFGTQHPSGRVSLANLNESDYRQIGRAMRRLIEEYVERYNKDTGGKLDKHAVK